MSASVVYALAFYAATAILVIGVVRKIVQYAKTPAPLKIPTMPAPVTQGGVVVRMFNEVVLFNSLFKSNKWIWIFGWMFHVSLLLALFRHLRYVIFPDSFLMPIIGFEIIQAFGKYAGFAMLVGLTGLFARRIFVDRVRYISSPSDYFMLLLILGIAGTGLMMSFVERIDIVMLKEFMLGLLVFNIQPLPTDLLLLSHLGLVITLMVIFPISKLLHAPGVFFSPTRNQVDNSREKRHLAPWAAELEADRKAGE
ncbi:MAG: sulfate reduction electron transfer complex DsrMKJOP subunit DsrM [Gammaproteobacteria bacterium]|nr:MAG: sulfate reduction electron transfer complex DsrMKJOP subunit DsrM [Gammaproteobacteria bacterium]